MVKWRRRLKGEFLAMDVVSHTFRVISRPLPRLIQFDSYGRPFSRVLNRRISFPNISNSKYR